MGARGEADTSGDPGRSARLVVVTEITFVGTSDAFGAGGRRQSAVLLRGASGSVLVDCGTTTGSGLHELGVSIDEIDVILISHFHADHFGGIPLLLLAALYEEHRKREIQIAGPPGIEARVRRLADAMGHGLDGRAWAFPIRFVELPAGVRSDLGPLSIRSFATHHNPDASPHGLLIEADNVKVAYSGDTGWFDGLPRQVAGSELFICECTYHRNGFDYHLSHEQLVKNRDRFDCGRVILTHLGQEMADRRGKSDFETADDGLTIRV
jgi:ribonuclease BN (tRNA processing enzyme)